MEEVVVTYKTFKFNELTEEVQEKVIEKNREDRSQYNNEHVFECCLDDWKEKLDKIGFYDPKIYFSGFWSQGDGACFETKECDLVEIMKHLIEVLPPKFKGKYRHLMPFIDEGTIYCSIYTNDFGHHYSHERTRNIDLEYPFWHERCPKAVALCKELREDLEEYRYDLAHELYVALEAEWDYHVSEECIKEDIANNDYTYLEDGKIF